MNREILFKAKRLDNGKWETGYYFKAGEKHMMLCFFTNENGLYHNMYQIDPKTLCQFTGLTDKNGKKIWENDIVRCGRNIVVSWDEHFASWCLTRKGWLYKHFFGESQNPEDCEVVGNIFDNPDLLEENHE